MSNRKTYASRKRRRTHTPHRCGFLPSRPKADDAQKPVGTSLSASASAASSSSSPSPNPSTPASSSSQKRPVRKKDAVSLLMANARKRATKPPSSKAKKKVERGGRARNGGERDVKAKLTQSLLDAGQRDIHSVTCSMCGMLYNRGQYEDEYSHKVFHAKYAGGISFKGWKGEKIVARFQSSSARIIVLDPAHSLKHVREKTSEVLKMVNKDLGGDDNDRCPPGCKLYAYVSKKRIVGALVAKRIKVAYPVRPQMEDEAKTKKTKSLPSPVVPRRSPRHKPKLRRTESDPIVSSPSRKNIKSKSHSDPTMPSGTLRIASEEPREAWLGVDKIWVHKLHRRKGIASRLVNAARDNLIYGMSVPKAKVAFSQPTQLGTYFAQGYTELSSFLVFRSL